MNLHRRSSDGQPTRNPSQGHFARASVALSSAADAAISALQSALRCAVSGPGNARFAREMVEPLEQRRLLTTITGPLATFEFQAFMGTSNQLVRVSLQGPGQVELIGATM